MLYGLLVLHGRDLIAVTVAVTGPFALAFGPVAMGPELCACIIAATYPESLLRR